MLVTLTSVANQKDKKHEKKNIYQIVVTFSILTLAQIDIYLKIKVCVSIILSV